MRTVLSAAMLMLLLSACAATQSGEPGTDVRLSVQPATAAAGDSVVLTLANDTAGRIGYNLCTSSLERQTGAEWELVPSDVVCTMELRTLDAGEEATYRTILPEGLTPGQYRYRTDVEDLQTNERYGVASSPFRLES